jgi:cytochrome c553
MTMPFTKRASAVVCSAFYAAVLGSAMLLPGFAEAGDVSAGKEKAQSCVMCHGANGIAQMPGAPNLAGQPAQYLAEQLINYRSGKRSNEIMGIIAKPLSDQDIANLAAWYASIPIEVKAN